MAFTSHDMRKIMDIMESASKPQQLNEAGEFDLSRLGIDTATGKITNPGVDADKKNLSAQIGIDFATGQKTKSASAFGDKKAGVIENPESVFKEMFPFTKLLRSGEAPDQFMAKFLAGDLHKLALHELVEYESVEQYGQLLYHKHIFVSKAGNYGVYVDVCFRVSEEDPNKGWRNGAPKFYMGGKTKEDLGDINQLFADQNIGQNKNKSKEELAAQAEKRAETADTLGLKVGDVVYKSRKTKGPLDAYDMQYEYKIVKFGRTGKAYIQRDGFGHGSTPFAVNPQYLRKK